ncbi:DUF6230 family protein [Nocardiopsis sp. RSe5-2]|uniref:DUF6230 family protein n=1 Tax=Nocardiopsis endophytica TaxID=3018445 RepID=A0ABT4U1R6_9ACTN|nr:DUF6230 family protein [Nocardiopsis endophytica]MDA2810896.1 DUF6230 family protein [Nocardiopsis endophytica]
MPASASPAGGAPSAGRTGWGRFAVVLLAALTAAAAMAFWTARGGVAASLAVSGHVFKVRADRLEGTGFAQYPDTAATADGEVHPVALTVIDSAELEDLCQSALVDTPVGQATFLVRAGGDGRPVEAEHMVVDMHQLTGDAEFGDIEIGRDASTLVNDSGRTGDPGGFALQGRTVKITGLRQRAYSVNAGTFTLTGLELDLKRGDHECF